MMKTKTLKLRQWTENSCPKIQISGSKSETNRLLILQKLYLHFEIKNASDAQDTHLLKQALENHNPEVDIHHAGTAMRFLTAYFAIQEGKETLLTGSSRMKQRPIAPLVEALRMLGADITYLENEGYPPLKIKGKTLMKSEVTISASISSQFISALLLIGGRLPQGLRLNLQGEITSRPYLEMTLQMLSDLGIKNEWRGQSIQVEPMPSAPKISVEEVESDWSSASYFYSLAAIGRHSVRLGSFKAHSKQGDAVLAQLYHTYFGIKTQFEPHHQIRLEPQPDFQFPELIRLDMNDCPDIAQTLCVTAAALKIPFEITGLATLKVKETDRLVALQNELRKIGVKTAISADAIKTLAFTTPELCPEIKTYHDHRMAMSFAPYALVAPLKIEDPEVVEKSYPRFWQDFDAVLKEK